MRSEKISVHSFDLDGFARMLVAASESTSPGSSLQIDYLARYCERLGAKAFIREEAYTDRHYLDEFAAYYSRRLRPLAHTVRRFHVFSRKMTDSDLNGTIDSALAGGKARCAIEEQLSSDYLGFISVRPIAAVPIGRTVLRKLSDATGEPREIWATSTHVVHVANLELRVDGLAFQQQDVAVGACATAALWSALSRVARHEGMRAPTPAQVSEAATRHMVPAGRALPALSGLTMPQLCDAIRQFGFAPEVMRADIRPELFLVAVHTYLLSGIPVVLGLRGHEEAHAVTAVGFRMGAEASPELQTTVAVRSALVKKLYVHDDRLGPYARAQLTAMPQMEDTDEALFLQIDFPDDDQVPFREAWLIESAVAPVYPKLRLSVPSLIMLAQFQAALMERVVGRGRRTELNVDFRYQRGGEVLRDLGPVATAAVFMRSVVLPRWCAIIRWRLGDVVVAEFLYDTTDILRESKLLEGELLRAVVCQSADHAADLRVFAEMSGVPFLGAGPVGG